ncbi:MAG: formyltetrahydrofolate deformylase [Verrucomicrobiota bacterium]|nr:formyltetrahydrofolate deformylase [Verrucomicrobiota bacterium]
MSSTTLTALLHGPDQKGLVARTAAWIFERGGNIIHADQHRDEDYGVFFQRVEWMPGDAETAQEMAAFRAFATTLGMEVRIARGSDRPRVVIFVSKQEHCFHDLLLRWKAGELPCDIRCIISNHNDLRRDADHYGVPYYVIPVTAATKSAAEATALSMIKADGIELVVLARYMQVLSGDFLEQLGRPVINIHHSFLPAFAGAKPYHQAHKRGVKIIGATAHYVTPVLDDGPIIQQAVAPVSHRQSVDDLIRKGRDLEKTVLAQAVRWHVENRVLAYANKTVVFD